MALCNIVKMISVCIVSSNRLPSNMFNIKTDMMYWLSDAGQLPMTLFQVAGQTVSDLVLTLPVLVRVVAIYSDLHQSRDCN